MKDLLTSLKKNPFILPIFLKEGISTKTPIPSLPGHYFWGIQNLKELSEDLLKKKIQNVAFYVIPLERSEVASEAFIDDGFVSQALTSLRELAPELFIITDICVCQFTSSGHCRVANDNGFSDEETLNNLSEQAILHIKCGADALMPSSMTPGEVRSIQEKLRLKGFNSIPIIPQAAKFASNLYSPFRHAAHASNEVDKSAYQLQDGSFDKAKRKLHEAVSEGASAVIIKPALFNLDLIRWASDELTVPVIAFSTSGEYQLFKDQSLLLQEYHDRLFSCGAVGVVSYFFSSS